MRGGGSSVRARLTEADEDEKLFSKITQENHEAKKRARQRGRLRIRPGPGRPADVPGISTAAAARPGTSPLPSLAKSFTSGDIEEAKASSDAPSKVDKGAKVKSSIEQEDYATLMDARDIAKQRLLDMQKEVCDLRNRFNLLKHEIERYQREKTEHDAALHVLEIEDDVKDQREQAQQQMKKMQVKLDKLKHKLASTEAYTSTLEFMLRRLQKKKLTFESTMRAYEESIRVQDEELTELKVLLSEVVQAKETEEHALAKMQELAQAQKVSLEEKLEQRRLEAVQREDMAKWEEERRLQLATAQAEAQGDMTAEEEQNLINQEKAMKVKTAAITSKQQRLDQEIEEYEMMFKRLSLATGLPNITPETVLKKYHGMADEMALVEEQIDEMNKRIGQLTAAKRQAKNHLQYGAGSDDAKAYDRSYVETLERRIESVKRELEGAKDEYDQMHNMHLQLIQSIDAMVQRTNSITVAKGAVMPSIEIGSLPADHPAATMVKKLRDVGQKLTYVIAQSARDAVGRRPETSPPATRGSVRTRADSVLSFSRGTVRDEEPKAQNDERQQRIFEEMEEMVAANEWNIRIRPGSAGKKPAMTARQINAAAAAFSAVHSKLVPTNRGLATPTSPSGRPRSIRSPSPVQRSMSPASATASGSEARATPALGAEGRSPEALEPCAEEGSTQPTTERRASITSAGTAGTAGTAGSVDLSQQASRTRRRSSRVSLMPVEAIPRSPDSSPDAAAAARWSRPKITMGRKKLQQSQMVRYTAAAVAMGGDEADDFVGQQKDHEAVWSRNKVKQDSTQLVRQEKRRIARRKRREAALLEAS